MRRFQIVVAWVDWNDPTISNRQLVFVNAKTSEEAVAGFHRDYGERHRIVRVMDRGEAKKTY